MTKRLLLVSLSVACVTAGLCGLAAGACAPDCSSACEPDCTGKAPMDKVEDTANCTKYYLCLDDLSPSFVSLPCPAGQEFNATAGACVTPTAGDPPCVASCTLPPCSTTCTSDPGTFPDPKNCSIYYVCVGGNLLGPVTCPADEPYFDSTVQACNASPFKCCSDPCVAYCQAGHAQTQDPYDCHKFYYCLADGPVDEMYHSSCPPGENFDPSSSVCVVGVPCNTLCSDTTVPGGGTTTPSSDCQESMTCTSVGLFAKCMTCDPQYFVCRNVGQPATVETCTGSLLFNTDPAFPYCVQPSDCPHHPAL